MFFVFYFLIIIPSAIIHEYAHGWMANRLGDPTARYAGRLTLNPLAHIDWWGTILMPLLLYFGTGGNFLFAYAKPVPYNPYNLKDQKWGPALVGLAGPMSNLFLAMVFAGLLHLPINDTLFTLFYIIARANVMLMVFNLLPIPPLDGSKIFFAILPDSAWRWRETLERYGFSILLIFILFFSGIITPVIDFITRLLVGA
jgi:Zn-dependent protease